LERCDFGGLNGTYTYMLIWPGGVGLCKKKKQAFFLSFVKLKFFLEIF
jgi:hypothetical protein